MKATDLRTKSEDELKQELLGLRFQAASGQLENTTRKRLVRRGIARIKTILRERNAQAQANKE